MLVTKLYSGHRDGSALSGYTVYLRGGFLHAVHFVILVDQSCLNAIWFLPVFCGRFWAVLAVSAAGFNQPAAICVCDVMLLKSASLSRCQFKPAVPVHQLTLHVLHPVSVDRDYVMQCTPE